MRDIKKIRAAHREACSMVKIFKDICEIHQDEDTTYTEKALQETRDNRDRLEDYLRRYDMDFVETMASITRELDRDYNDMVAANVIPRH